MKNSKKIYSLNNGQIKVNSVAALTSPEAHILFLAQLPRAIITRPLQFIQLKKESHQLIPSLWAHTSLIVRIHSA
jgi:hypothetical protein